MSYSDIDLGLGQTKIHTISIAEEWFDERRSVLVPTFQAVRWYVHPSGLYQTSPHRLSGARPCRWKWFWSKIEYRGQSLYGNNSIWAPELYQGEKLEETQSRPHLIHPEVNQLHPPGLTSPPSWWPDCWCGWWWQGWRPPSEINSGRKISIHC